MASSSGSRDYSQDSDSDSGYESAHSHSDFEIRRGKLQGRRVEISEDDKDSYEQQRIEIRRMKRRSAERGVLLLHPGQEELADEICEKFKDPKVLNVMVVAKPQWGKTGSMLGVIERMVVPRENVFIITGLSSVDWVEQTKSRMPEFLQKNVIHRNKMSEFVERVRESEMS
jgi:hypothetical protein